jgi:hypothetical protein
MCSLTQIVQKLVEPRAEWPPSNPPLNRTLAD